MPARTKKSKALLARIVEMRAAGASDRAIAKKTGVSPTAIAEWLEELGLKKKKPARAPSETPPARRRKSAEEVMAVAMRLQASESDHDGLGHVRTRLSQLRQLIDVALPDVMAGDMNPQSLNTMTSLELKYEAELVRLEMLTKPPERPDPAKDPDVLEAADRCAAKFEQAVAREELKRRCLHCGKHPDR